MEMDDITTETTTATTTTTADITKPIENLSKKPAKSILKTSSSGDSHSASQLNRQSSQDRDLKWDEMNILQTLHPPDKDYGHMKIEEPKTPYSYFNEDDDGECHSDNEMPTEIDPENLAKLIEKSGENNNKKSKLSNKNRFSFDEMKMEQDLNDDDNNNDDDNDSDDDKHENETEEERLRRKEFEQKRKKHYNEYQMVKLARKLMKDEMDEDEEED